jgi:hypothetical protein
MGAICKLIEKLSLNIYHFACYIQGFIRCKVAFSKKQRSAGGEAKQCLHWGVKADCFVAQNAPRNDMALRGGAPPLRGRTPALLAGRRDGVRAQPSPTPLVKAVDLLTMMYCLYSPRAWGQKTRRARWRKKSFREKML